MDYVAFRGGCRQWQALSFWCFQPVAGGDGAVGDKQAGTDDDQGPAGAWQQKGQRCADKHESEACGAEVVFPGVGVDADEFGQQIVEADFSGTVEYQG